MSFFTHFTGGAERLPNGNTLITEGASGRLFEVTPANRVVWEYISPFFANGQQGFTNGVFRGHRYGPDHPALAGRDLIPATTPTSTVSTLLEALRRPMLSLPHGHPLLATEQARFSHPRGSTS